MTQFGMTLWSQMNLTEFAFILTEWREEVALKLSEEEESLDHITKC